MATKASRIPDNEATDVAVYRLQGNFTVPAATGGFIRIVLAPWTPKALSYNITDAVNTNGSEVNWVSILGNPMQTYANVYRVVSAEMRIVYVGAQLNATGTVVGSSNNNAIITDACDKTFFHTAGAAVAGLRTLYYPHGAEDFNFITTPSAGLLTNFMNNTVSVGVFQGIPTTGGQLMISYCLNYEYTPSATYIDLVERDVARYPNADKLRSEAVNVLEKNRAVVVHQLDIAYYRDIVASLPVHTGSSGASKHSNTRTNFSQSFAHAPVITMPPQASVAPTVLYSDLEEYKRDFNAAYIRAPAPQAGDHPALLAHTPADLHSDMSPIHSEKSVQRRTPLLTDEQIRAITEQVIRRSQGG